jgi:hypothetical protein
MLKSRYPLLYQVNTRVWLEKIGRESGREATLDDIPQAELERIAGLGFEWLYCLGVWQTGAAGRQVSRTQPAWQEEFQRALPDLHQEDICGSCFAVTGYVVSPSLGGGAALERLRTRLQALGLRLMLDYVPNHTAIDHPWVEQHPEYYIPASEDLLAAQPQNFLRLESGRILAYGRDPYFPGWPDTLQLNYGSPDLQEAMTGELLRAAALCDGLRADMAMLVLPDVFERTWGITSAPFWPQAIQRVRQDYPQFTFMAEAYWDLEWTLQQQGFDYTYDKRLYDRLVAETAQPVHDHLLAGLDYQDHMARFLENHDEPRAAATFASGTHEAAALVTFLSPGLRFFHQGQLQGCRVKVPVHLCRGPEEVVDAGLEGFYTRLLMALKRPAARDGNWSLLETLEAWEGNPTWTDFIAFAWQGRNNQRLLLAVNYSPHQSQCYVRLPFEGLPGFSWGLCDLMSTVFYERDGSDLQQRGLYLDLPAWSYHLFELESGG